MKRLGSSFCILLVAASAAACSRGETPSLMNLRQTGDGPDEFAILPTRPLEMPENFAELPPPTLGGTNRTDPDPEADAIAALGGNVDRGAAAGGVVSYVSRFGVASDIRGVLAAEDEDFRRDHNPRLLERVFAITTYYNAYEDVALDQYSELSRMRRAGVRTVAAPPNPEAE